MTMLAPALLTALAASTQAPASPPPMQARAQTQVFVQIIQAAEVRAGESSTRHQRSTRLDEFGRTMILLQFE